MSAHAFLPPSGAGIWGKSGGCTAWPTMVQLYPDTSDDTAAREGVASHEIGATLINRAATGITLTPDYFIDKPASNGVIFTAEMFHAAKIYADHVINVMRSTGVFGGAGFGTERKISIADIHDQCDGTPDQFIFDEVQKQMHIWDYKYGFEIVEHFENWQLTTYARGVTDLLHLNGRDEQIVTVHLHVIQPRAVHRGGPIRTWSTTLANLRVYWNITRSNAVDAAAGGETVTGSHCKYCPARHACDAARHAGMSLYETAMKPAHGEIPPAALGLQLYIARRAAEQLKLLVTGYEEQVKRTIKNGTGVPGWTVQKTFGRQKWAKPVSEIITLGTLLGVDLKKPDEAITPNQAEKLGIDKGVITAYSHMVETGVEVTPATESKIKQLFED